MPSDQSALLRCAASQQCSALTEAVREPMQFPPLAGRIRASTMVRTGHRTGGAEHSDRADADLDLNPPASKVRCSPPLDPLCATMSRIPLTATRQRPFGIVRLPLDRNAITSTQRRAACGGSRCLPLP
jgi:hypothetical protein